MFIGIEINKFNENSVLNCDIKEIKKNIKEVKIDTKKD